MMLVGQKKERGGESGYVVRRGGEREGGEGEREV